MIPVYNAVSTFFGKMGLYKKKLKDNTMKKIPLKIPYDSSKAN